MVSPIPSFSRMPDRRRRPDEPLHAHAGLGQARGAAAVRSCARDRGRSSIRSRGRDTLHEMMIWSLAQPASSASSVDCERREHHALVEDLLGRRARDRGRCSPASSRMTSSWFSEPPLTPMRTGLPWSTGDLADGRELLVAALAGADVARVDAVLVERRCAVAGSASAADGRCSGSRR